MSDQCFETEDEEVIEGVFQAELNEVFRTVLEASGGGRCVMYRGKIVSGCCREELFELRQRCDKSEELACTIM